MVAKRIAMSETRPMKQEDAQRNRPLRGAEIRLGLRQVHRDHDQQRHGGDRGAKTKSVLLRSRSSCSVIHECTKPPSASSRRSRPRSDEAERHVMSRRNLRAGDRLRHTGLGCAP